MEAVLSDVSGKRYTNLPFIPLKIQFVIVIAISHCAIITILGYTATGMELQQRKSHTIFVLAEVREADAL